MIRIWLGLLWKVIYVFNIIAPVIRFTFEISSTYVKLIPNLNVKNIKVYDPIEPEFAHLVNKEMKYDQLIAELRYCGVILYPSTQDLTNANLQVKVNNHITIL